MGRYVVKSNNHERDLLAWDQLPESVREDFDYVTGEDRSSPRFVEYLGSWYDTSDTEGLAPADLASLGWSTYLTDSFFSGVVFRHFTRDGEYMDDAVVVGRFYVEG